MIGEHKQIKEDWYMFELKGTRYYQIWNKWDLFEHLLSSQNPEVKGLGLPPHMTLWDEDLPLTTQQLEDILNDLEQLRQERLHYLSYTNKQNTK
jgi:hypothetical protein